MHNLLVVDDHPFFLHGFSQYLGATDEFKVEAALSVDEAISKIEIARPDLAMLDVTMHGGGGLRLRHCKMDSTARLLNLTVMDLLPGKLSPTRALVKNQRIVRTEPTFYHLHVNDLVNVKI